MTGIGAAMAGGNPRRGRQHDDFYGTPVLVTQALLDTWRPRSPVVWECACGDGAMSSVIEQYGYRVVSTDLVDRGYGQPGVDFLATKERLAGCIISNPPFTLAAKFIRHAFEIGVTELALVLKSTYWHAMERQSLWRDHRPSVVMPLLWRPDFLNLGRPTMEVSWNIWREPCAETTVYRPLVRPMLKINRGNLLT